MPRKPSIDNGVNDNGDSNNNNAMDNGDEFNVEAEAFGIAKDLPWNDPVAIRRFYSFLGTVIEEGLKSRAARHGKKPA